jgi:hypothetical protein
MAIMEAGYNLDSLMLKYQGVDWRNKSNWHCNRESVAAISRCRWPCLASHFSEAHCESAADGAGGIHCLKAHMMAYPQTHWR